MFQAVQNAFDTLSDPIKRKQYDKELKYTNSKDGMSVKPQESAGDKLSPKASREGRISREAIVELPSNPSTLTIGELKSLISSLGINSDGCFEKQDYVDKIIAYKKKKSSSKLSGTTHDSNKGSEYTAPVHKVLPNPIPAVKVISDRKSVV